MSPEVILEGCSGDRLLICFLWSKRVPEWSDSHGARRNMGGSSGEESNLEGSHFLDRRVPTKAL